MSTTLDPLLPWPGHRTDTDVPHPRQGPDVPGTTALVRQEPARVAGDVASGRAQLAS